MKTRVAGMGLILLMTTPAWAQNLYQPAPNGANPLGGSELGYTASRTASGVPVWTAQDVQALCESRFPNQMNSIRSCMERNNGKVGRPQSPGDMQALNMSRNAAKKAPPAQPVPSAAMPAPAARPAVPPPMAQMRAMPVNPAEPVAAPPPVDDHPELKPLDPNNPALAPLGWKPPQEPAPEGQ